MDMLELTFKSKDSNFFQSTSIWLALDAVRDEFEEFAFCDDSPSDTEGVVLKDPCVLQPNSETLRKKRSKFHLYSNKTLEQMATEDKKQNTSVSIKYNALLRKQTINLCKNACLFDYCIVSNLWVTLLIFIQ